MRRSHLVLLTLVALTATTSAQRPAIAPAVFKQEIAVVGQALVEEPHASLEELVGRVMSYDRNGDGKIARDELAERMEPLIAKGDVDGNGVLEENEIQLLALQPPIASAPRGFERGHYGFNDSSLRPHVEGALADLRLASPAREEALAIVNAFVDDLEKTTSEELLGELEGVLTPAQLTRFKTLMNRQVQVRKFVTGNDGQKMVFQSAIFMDLSQQVLTFGLPEPEKIRAQAAVDRFKKRLLPGEAERVALLAQLTDVLNDEERDDFRAALERRPIGKAGFSGQIVQGGAVLGGVIQR